MGQQAATRGAPYTRLLAGAGAGFLATGPMSLAMVLMHRLLPARQRYPLPPEQITLVVGPGPGAIARWHEPARTIATGILHFGIGATGGAGYALLAQRVRLQSLLRGIAYGLLIWTAGYLGVLPGLGILRPATAHPAGRNLLMISAHVVWGAVLAALYDAWEQKNSRKIAEKGETHA
ncbi:MAG TPA: DUF6789 family protein [Chloroflexia bacterium]|nr:DUF6789 family protein [Chloroflexia bacterium]